MGEPGLDLRASSLRPGVLGCLQVQGAELECKALEARVSVAFGKKIIQEFPGGLAVKEPALSLLWFRSLRGRRFNP